MSGAPPAGHAVLAIGMPDRNSWFILLGFLAALVLFVWLLSRAIRRQGGMRRTFRRIVWESRMTARAFAEPLRAYRRYRRRVRALAAFFDDPGAPDAAHGALDRADSLAGQSCYVPTVHLSPARDRTRLVVAGRDPLGPALPFAPTGDEPGDWAWSAPAERARADDGEVPADGRERLLLVLGVDRRLPGVVLVDWLRGPAALAVEGDPRAARGVLHALAAQIDRTPAAPSVQVARGVHPRFSGPELDDLLDTLETASVSVSDDPALVPVLVCWAPSREQAGRLATLSAAGRVRVLAGGRLPGACWSLHAEPDGRLLGPGMGIDVESGALGRAVARAVRRSRRRAPAGLRPSASASPASPASPAALVADAGTRGASRALAEPGRAEPVAPPVVAPIAAPASVPAEPDTASVPAAGAGSNAARVASHTGVATANEAGGATRNDAAEPTATAPSLTAPSPPPAEPAAS
ncbi:hypothetical protein, partial [Streptomyces sp. H27-D2]|uniref:hypothetical protein n=1 Tax=Streptomyces sp. H27-D2 TaxID=3046304 RepID=UPI002DBABD33